MKLKLPGTLHKEVVTALMDAFPTREALTRMVRHRMDQNLNVIAGGTTLHDLAFDLVNWAEAQDQVAALLRAAREENPTNVALIKLIQQVAEPPLELVDFLRPLPADYRPAVLIMLTPQAREPAEIVDWVVRATNKASFEGWPDPPVVVSPAGTMFGLLPQEEVESLLRQRRSQRRVMGDAETVQVPTRRRAFVLICSHDPDHPKLIVADRVDPADLPICPICGAAYSPGPGAGATSSAS